MASSVAAPSGVVAGHVRAKWTRVATLGFLLVAAGMTLWIVGGLIAGQELGGELPFLAGAAVAGLIAAGSVWRFGTAGKAVGIVLGVLLLGAMFWVAFSLAAPSAFVEFSGAVMFVMGGLTGIGYSIGGLVRRREVAMEATRGETMAMRVMLGIVALALVASAVLNFTGRTSVDAAAAAGATPVTMSSFQFAPAAYTATADETTTFLIHNGDAFTHDFAIESLDINSGLLSPGSEKLIEVTAPAGEYIIRCTLHSGSGDELEEGEMKALLTVQ